MNSIFKKAPMLREKNTIHKIILFILTVLSSACLFAPVLVGIISKFTQGNNSAAYCIFKGLFASSVLVCTAFYFTRKRISVMVLPIILGLITVMFPLFESIGDYSYIKSIAEKYNMAQDYTAYLLSIGIYLLYAILCVFSFFYASGMIKSPLVIYLISVVSSLATIFMAVDKAMNSDATIFELITFASASITCMIPFAAAISTQKKISNKFKPERIRR